MPKKSQPTLGDLIRAGRLERGLSQQELAQILGVSPGQIISNWERNYGSLISAKHLSQLMILFKLDRNITLNAYLELDKARTAKKTNVSK